MFSGAAKHGKTNHPQKNTCKCSVRRGCEKHDTAEIRPQGYSRYPSGDCVVDGEPPITKLCKEAFSRSSWSQNGCPPIAKSEDGCRKWAAGCELSSPRAKWHSLPRACGKMQLSIGRESHSVITPVPLLQKLTIRHTT
ncbi:hypothetical protein MCOR31_009089 [Pyricularia oryzae]|nr:hypothetical protein MCOR31_009089 [Pyricularia oryzae]